MHFGIFFEISVPRPFTRQAEQKVIFEALEVAQLAEELGLGSVWVVEHHFVEEHSHMPASDVFLAAVAMKTSRIRLGLGIMNVLPPVNHPARCAERAAVLDILSGGRVEVGSGRANTWVELGGFNVRPEDTKAMWAESIAEIPKMWTQDYYEGHQGTYFSMPPRRVQPKPAQEPHPPLWVGVTTPETADEAADRGLGMLGLGGSSGKERIANYRRRIEDCTPVGGFINDRVLCTAELFCHENGAYGIEQGKLLRDTFNGPSNFAAAVRQVYPSRAYRTDGLLRDMAAHKAPSVEKGDGPRATAPWGTPDQVREACEQWEEMGVDGLLFVLNAQDVIPHDEVKQSLRLFAAEVLPRFGPGRPLGAPALAGARDA